MMVACRRYIGIGIESVHLWKSWFKICFDEVENNVSFADGFGIEDGLVLRILKVFPLFLNFIGSLKIVDNFATIADTSMNNILH